MSTTVSPSMPTGSYLTDPPGLRAWLLTRDHKRIGLMFLTLIATAIALGATFGLLIRTELTLPGPTVVSTGHAYNRLFTLHGTIMIFLFIIPSMPASFGNFVLPLMLGARDVAFPRLNLASLYLYVGGLVFFLLVLVFGGIDTGWTFYTPYSTRTCRARGSGRRRRVHSRFQFHFHRPQLHSHDPYDASRGHDLVSDAPIPLGALRHGDYPGIGHACPGDHAAAVGRRTHLGRRHLRSGAGAAIRSYSNTFFWFYSHPAVYIMILPAMGIVTEVIAVFSRKHIFGYRFIAYSSLGIALIGFLVWGHHMFVSGQSPLVGMIFSALTFAVAIPSAIKVFNWLTTMYKGSITLAPPMCFALSFIALFGIGGLTGLFLGALAINVQVHDTAFVVAHFHYTMAGGALMGFLAGLYYWWPKMTGRMYSIAWGQASAVLIFIGFNFTYFPQFIIGSRGMPRRYFDYTRLLQAHPEFTFYQILSTIGGYLFVGGLILVAVTLLRSLFVGKRAPANPWGAATLEWQCDSPPPHENVPAPPVVGGAYDYEDFQFDEETRAYVKLP